VLWLVESGEIGVASRRAKWTYAAEQRHGPTNLDIDARSNYANTFVERLEIGKFLSMPHATRSTIDRLLTVLVALAVACLPSSLRADCEGDYCECVANDSACCQFEATRTCCDPGSCGPASCDCEIRRSDSPAIPQHQREQNCGPSDWYGTAVCDVALSQRDTLGAYSPSDVAPSGPALRILYCVWRN
jgi:hypothetical protein